jgi:hypothetical protein
MKTTSTQERAQQRIWVRRLALLVGVPLAVLGGVRAVSWAAVTLKAWIPGETLTAADLNGNFAAIAAALAPDQAVANFNAGTMAGAAVKLGAITATAAQYDLRWMMQHAAAGGACAAASPVGDSVAGHVVLPKPTGVTCTAACAANTGGLYSQCRTSIAIGSVRMTQATVYTDQLALNYNYGCNDNQSNYDEVTGQGLTTSYTAYCCCYR